MDDVHEDIDNYNPKTDKKVLIVFDDMIADIMINKKLQAIIKELFIRCRKLNISLVFSTQPSVPNNARLNSTHYLIMKISNRIELKSIAINHSADIDYQGFKKIYRERVKEPFNFWQLILRYQQMILYYSDKIYLILMKMTITDQIKILERKIMQNQAQYYLDSKAAKISAFSSNNLDKYEYLICEDLGLKPSTVEQV